MPESTKRWLIFVVALVLSNSALAHNVVGGVYAIGSLIEGEAGFSNGDMAKAGTPVLIMDSNLQPIGETATDDEGLFAFQATQRIDYHFRLDMGAGHVLEMVLPADELPDTLQAGSSDVEVPVAMARAVKASSIDDAQLQQMIEQAVAKQIKPLRKELAAYKEKASLQDVLGGIGYIFGLCGLGIWWRQRKQDKARATVS